MARYDLHTHSTVSDGAFPPAEVVRRAKAAGLDGIALSDHDSTAGVAEARAEGERIGLEVLLGCELSAQWQGASVHMLAYFVDPDHPRWREELGWMRDDRVARAEAMVQRLCDLGVPVTMEQVRSIAKGESIGRPHVAQALVDLGIVEKTPDAFTPEWIGDGGRAYVSRKEVTPHDAVGLVSEAGGVAVVAHPIWIERELSISEAERLIKECADLGLAGVEVNHPDQDEEWRARWRAMAGRLDLIATSSSDWHGNLHGGSLGENWSSEEVVQALRARAPGRRTA